MTNIQEGTLVKFAALSYEISELHSLTKAGVDGVHKGVLESYEYNEHYKRSRLVVIVNKPSSKIKYGCICCYLIDKSLIISFKGTSTLGDVFTDVNTKNNDSLNRWWTNTDSRMHISEGFLGYCFKGVESFIRLSGKSNDFKEFPKSIMHDFDENYIAYFNDEDETFPVSDVKGGFIPDDLNEVYLVGHSLGGAAASLMATSSCFLSSFNNSGTELILRTYGAPCIGDAPFVKHFNDILERFNVNFFRYVNHYDPIPLLLNGRPDIEYDYSKNNVKNNIFNYLFKNASNLIYAVALIPSFALNIIALRRMHNIGFVYRRGKGLIGFIVGRRMIPKPTIFFQTNYGVCLQGDEKDFVNNHKISKYVDNLKDNINLKTLMEESVRFDDYIKMIKAIQKNLLVKIN